MCLFSCCVWGAHGWGFLFFPMPRSLVRPPPPHPHKPTHPRTPTWSGTRRTLTPPHQPAHSFIPTSIHTHMFTPPPHKQTGPEPGAVRGRGLRGPGVRHRRRARAPHDVRPLGALVDVGPWPGFALYVCIDVALPGRLRRIYLSTFCPLPFSSPPSLARVD